MESKSPIEKFRELKALAGTHSPSIETIKQVIPEINIRIDACFLSNPYATELFLEYFEKDFSEFKKLRDVLEFYPPQNVDVAKILSPVINVPFENVFVGNGAIEIIQAVIKNYCGTKILLPIPTFSSYYEFVGEGQAVEYLSLNEEDEFAMDVDLVLSRVESSQCTSLVLINPNNPNGGYLTKSELITLLDGCVHLETVILDESFAHFAYESSDLDLLDVYHLIEEYANLVVVKSMSKDFGIAGIRSGYGVMHEDRVKSLLKTGYLWNISGLSNYFFNLYSGVEFRSKYEIVRKKYILNTREFMRELSKLKGIKVFPSKANFALIKVLKEDLKEDFGMKLLVDHGVYVRNCDDKIGLTNGYYRVASRSFEENLEIIDAIKSVLCLR